MGFFFIFYFLMITLKAIKEIIILFPGFNNFIFHLIIYFNVIIVTLIAIREVIILLLSWSRTPSAHDNVQFIH